MPTVLLLHALLKVNEEGDTARVEAEMKTYDAMDAYLAADVSLSHALNQNVATEIDAKRREKDQLEKELTDAVLAMMRLVQQAIPFENASLHKEGATEDAFLWLTDDLYSSGLQNGDVVVIRECGGSHPSHIKALEDALVEVQCTGTWGGPGMVVF